MSGKAVLITGATGFIGSHLARRLAGDGYRVRALLREESRTERIAGRNIEMFYGDLRLPETLAGVAAGVSEVFHCAAVTTDWAPRKTYYEVNVLGTRNLLEACARAAVERFVFLSTNDVFGLTRRRLVDERSGFRVCGEPYPDTKLLAEKLVWQYRRDIPVTVVYPCWVYGPDDTNLLGPIVESALRKQMIPCCKESMVWPTYVENLVDFLVLAGEDRRAVGNGYLVHDGQGVPAEEFCREIAGGLKLDRFHTVVPYWLLYSTAFVLQIFWKTLGIRGSPLLTTYVAKNLGARVAYSTRKATDLGWRPRISYKEGLAITIKWMQQKYA